MTTELLVSALLCGTAMGFVALVLLNNKGIAAVVFVVGAVSYFIGWSESVYNKEEQ